MGVIIVDSVQEKIDFVDYLINYRLACNISSHIWTAVAI